MNRDIITGMDGEIYARRDLSREWGGAIDLGTARTGKSFGVDGHRKFGSETPSFYDGFAVKS